MKLLRTKYTGFAFCGFREEDFFMFFFFHYKPMADNDIPGDGDGPVWTPGARLAGFIKRTTIHKI